MSDPRTNFDEQLRSTLERHAGAAPRVDLTDSALDRARGIRRRRRLGAAVAVAAVVAAAAPVGAALIGDQSPRGDGFAGQPSTTSAATQTEPTVDPSPSPDQQPVQKLTLDLSLTALPRGDDLTVPYLDDGAWVSGDTRTPLDLPADAAPLDAAEFAEGLVAWAVSPEDGSVRMYPQGFEPGLDLGGPAAGPVVDGWTGATAFVLDGNTVYYGENLRADLPSLTLEGLDGVQVLDAYDGVVVVSGEDDTGSSPRPMVGRIDFGTTPATYEPMFDPADWVEATAFSIQANLMAQLGQDTVPGDPNDARCAVMTDLDHVNRGGWDSCTWRPVSFAPDGTRVFALDTRTEGFGPRNAAILDARSGEVLVDLTTEGTFGFTPHWESDDVVDLVLVQDGQSAIVRCTVGVGCELGTDPKAAAIDSLVEPYQVTDH